MKCCEKETIILSAKKWKLTNLVERQVNDPIAITCPNGKNHKKVNLCFIYFFVIKLGYSSFLFGRPVQE